MNLYVRTCIQVRVELSFWLILKGPKGVRKRSGSGPRRGTVKFANVRVRSGFCDTFAKKKKRKIRKRTGTPGTFAWGPQGPGSWQVLREIGTHANPFAPLVGAERESFQEGLIEFHGGTRAAEGPKGVKPQRSKAYQLVKSLDTVLKGCCQVGLGHWKAPFGEDLDHQIKTGVGCRVLSIAMDEASPSYSAYWFLAFHEQLCIVAVPDPSHRVWNDMRLAIAATGLWSHVLLDALVYRLPHGPWETSSGLEQTKAGLQLFLQGSSTSDPLFPDLVAQGAQGLGLGGPIG